MLDLKILNKNIKNTKINISEKDVFSFLQIRKRWPMIYSSNQPTIELIDNLGNNISGNSLFFDSEGYLIFNNWLKFYELGYTTIISNVLDLHQDLRKLDDYLSKNFGKRINANFYFSKGGQVPSFSLHNHNYTVIVKQIYGTGHWVLENNKLILENQDTLIIPTRCNHKVYKITDKKLSLTINLE